jgi:hypothetical protein
MNTRLGQAGNLALRDHNGKLEIIPVATDVYDHDYGMLNHKEVYQLIEILTKWLFSEWLEDEEEVE